MKRLILATVAAATLCVPALAQPSQAPETPHQNVATQSQTGTNQHMAASQLNTNQVREIQQALDHKGFKAGRVDGKWGPETDVALKDFQKSQNMPTSGNIDRMTIVALGLKGSDFGMNVGTTGQAPSGSGHKSQAPGQTNPPNNQPAPNGGGSPNNEH